MAIPLVPNFAPSGALYVLGSVVYSKRATHINTGESHPIQSALSARFRISEVLLISRLKVPFLPRSPKFSSKYAVPSDISFGAAVDRGLLVTLISEETSPEKMSRETEKHPHDSTDLLYSDV